MRAYYPAISLYLLHLPSSSRKPSQKAAYMAKTPSRRVNDNAGAVPGSEPTPSKPAKSKKTGTSNASKNKWVLCCSSCSLLTGQTSPPCRSPNRDRALTLPVKMEYESDTIRAPSPELGAPPPSRLKGKKGKNRARSISPVNLASDDEAPAESIVEK